MKIEDRGEQSRERKKYQNLGQNLTEASNIQNTWGEEDQGTYGLSILDVWVCLCISAPTFAAPGDSSRVRGTKWALLGKERETSHWSRQTPTLRHTAPAFQPPRAFLLLHFLCWNKHQRCFFAHWILTQCQETKRFTSRAEHQPEMLHQRHRRRSFHPEGPTASPP